ncbi:MAG: InlB B-repeat-containing protein, partial [Spirochaetaceae bacterium]
IECGGSIFMPPRTSLNSSKGADGAVSDESADMQGASPTLVIYSTMITDRSQFRAAGIADIAGNSKWETRMVQLRGRKQRWSVMVVVTTVVVLAIVSGCNRAGAGGDPETYTVSFDANGAHGGTTPDDQTKIDGEDLTLRTNSGNLARDGYAFAGWNTADDGSGTDYAEAATYTADADLTLYAKWMPYNVGDVGPAGGIVFYDKGVYSDGWRYLEAAPSDIDVSGDYSHVWGGYGTSVGGTGNAIGTGAANTQAIVAEYGDEEPHEDRADYAAKLCNDLEYGGYDDWFLPSRDELNEMYTQREDIGGFASAFYWSSSELTELIAWAQYFPTDGQSDHDKTDASRVRAARAF